MNDEQQRIEMEDMADFYAVNSTALREYSSFGKELYRERKLTLSSNTLPDLLEHNGGLYLKKKNCIINDIDGDRAESANYILVTDDAVYQLHERAKTPWDVKDKLRFRLEKYLDWDVNSPINLPSGASLVYSIQKRDIYGEPVKNRDTNIWQVGELYFIEMESVNIGRECYSLHADPDSDIMNVAFAVHAAISEQKEREAIRCAKAKLKHWLSCHR